MRDHPSNPSASSNPAAGSPSRFLPVGFDPLRPVAVVAGQGIYPQLTIAAMERAGVPVRLVELEGETAADTLAMAPPEHRQTVKVGQIGRLLKVLRGFEAGAAIMVGRVSPRRLFQGLHPDLKAITLLAGLKERNAETIFGAIAREIEAIGIHLLDARAFLDGAMARPGVMTGGRLKADPEQIAYGIRIAREVAKLDIGQGVVVRKGTVLAVEAYEGTDDMLRRANKYKTDGLIFVKSAKPGQDWRFDVPCFGVQTLAAMREGGVTTAALEVDGVLILEHERVITEARTAGIELYGWPE